jgi:hypothetical protein
MQIFLDRCKDPLHLSSHGPEEGNENDKVNDRGTKKLGIFVMPFAVDGAGPLVLK